MVKDAPDAPLTVAPFSEKEIVPAVEVAGDKKYGAAAKRAVKAAWKKVGLTV